MDRLDGVPRPRAALAEAEAFREPKAKADAFDAWASYLDKLHSLFASSAAALLYDGPPRRRPVHAVATSRQPAGRRAHRRRRVAALAVLARATAEPAADALPLKISM